MCGRYATTRSTLQLRETFSVHADHAEEVTRQDFNVAPTKKAPIVLTASLPDAATAERVRQIRLAKWGLRPHWMKDPKKPGFTNARAETIDEKPSFRTPFARRRCIVPADGFYEWFTGAAGGKQPYYFRPADGSVLAMAGLVEFWREADDGPWLPTYTIITTTANDSVGLVHDRMPLVIRPDSWEAWLDPAITDAATARRLMAPPDADSLEIYPVSSAVNAVRNNGPELLTRITL